MLGIWAFGRETPLQQLQLLIVRSENTLQGGERSTSDVICNRPRIRYRSAYSMRLRAFSGTASSKNFSFQLCGTRSLAVTPA